MCIPPGRQPVLPRARLTTAIERQLPAYKLVSVSAPAGYGKTTLLAAWARASRFPVAWLSLGRDDNDPERFLRYLFKAWQRVQPEIAANRLGVLLAGNFPDRRAALSAFANAAGELPAHTAFVLDDCHLIENETVHETLTFLLDHLPPKAHFVLSGRAELPLPLARYRARRELLEFQAADLQFSLEESEGFFNRLMALDLDPQAVAALQERLEGWAAGMQLAALALRSSAGVGKANALKREPGAAGDLPVSGRQRFIADYLSQEVLYALPAARRDFLLRTGILERLCGPLCDAVTKGKGGQAVLEELERENLFLAPLDDDRRWFRYHGIFADFLRGELERRYPGEVEELHRRAARWHSGEDMPEEAFRHAIAGGDVRQAVRVGERHITVKILRGEINTVAGWLEALPAEWGLRHPGFEIGRAAFLFQTGAFERAAQLLDEVEGRLASVESKERARILGQVISLRCAAACMQGDLPGAEIHARQAFQHLPEDAVVFRTSINMALGDSYRQAGRWEEARQSYRRALALMESDRLLRFGSAHVYGALADLDLRRGRLRAAAAHWRKALTAIHDPANWGGLPLPLIGWVHIRMAEIMLEWDNLPAAREHLNHGRERAELGGDPNALTAAFLLAGNLALAEGDPQAAAEHLERARPLVEEAPYSNWTARFQRLQLEIWLAGDPHRAATRAREMLAEGVFEGRPESEPARAAAARALIAAGDAVSRQEARALLDDLAAVAEEQDRAGILIETLALQALANWTQGDRAAALTALERALRLAEPEGYVRLFAALGLSFARVLQEARARGVMPAYADRVLAAFSGDLPAAAGGDKALPEPLTPREIEVLELLAAGLTNREIADRLVISAETVKKHTGNIYGKLGVSNRTEAAARARELQLLG